MVIGSAGPKMYRPVLTSDAAARVREPFSTALSLPICAEVTPFHEGTGRFFISDPHNPGKIYLVTARHVLFHPDESPNELYRAHNSGGGRRNVLLFGDDAIEKHIAAIEPKINGQDVIIEHLEGRLEDTEQMDKENAEAERNQILPQLEEARKNVEALKKFLADNSRDWKKRENRVLGYVVLSPPISFNVGEEVFTEDWAVIEINNSKVDSTNFVGNVDLGTDIPIDEFTDWMYPTSFKFLRNRLLKFHGTISNREMYKPDLRTLDHDHDPYIMVIKRGYATGLTVGRLNGIRSFTRYYSKGLPSQMSKEVAVLPRNSKSGPFSANGDSGSAVIDGKGRLAGLLTGGAGVSELSDVTYVTSINFLQKRMLEHGLHANFFPSPMLKCQHTYSTQIVH